MNVQKKKIVFLIGALHEGGAERVVSTLASKMASKGLPVSILTYYNQEISYDIDPKVEIISVKKETGSKSLLRNFTWIRRFFKEHAQVIISFLAVFNILAILASAFLHIPIIVADRNDPRAIPANKGLRLVRNFLYRFANKVVLQTEYNKAYFSKAVQKKSVIIYNPLDLKEHAASALHCNKKNEIISVGRLLPQKNQEMLIRAFAQLHSSFPEYSLSIYGEGPCRETYESLIQQLGMEKAIFLPGHVKNIHEQIKQAQLFVLTSHHEGMSNALLEALGLGLPVISTDVSGAKEMVTNGKNGFVIPCNDIDALLEAMREMLSNHELRHSCAANAVQINDQLAADRICNHWLQLVEALHAK